VRTHGIKNPVPWPASIYVLSIRSMVWNVSTGQLGLAAWLLSFPALLHLLISRTWKNSKKSPWFLSNS